jgi:hypothetical protein
VDDMTRRLGLPLLLSVFAACGDAPGTPAADAFTVRDSAGVRIVENSDSAWTADTRWRLADEPDLRIGSLDGSLPGTDWGDFVQARAFGDGVVVTDPQTVGFRFFDAEGAWERTLVREGEGPTELQFLNVWQIFGDRITATDVAAGVEIHPKGDSIRPLSIAQPPGAEEDELFGVAIPMAWFADGSYLQAMMPNLMELESGMQSPPMTYHRISREGEHLGEVASVPLGSFHVKGPRDFSPVPFVPPGMLVTAGTAMYEAFPDSSFEWRRRRADGALDLVVRLPLEGEEITEAFIARSIERQLTMLEGLDIPAAMLADAREEIEAGFRGPGVPDRAGLFLSLRVTEAGYVLAELPDWEVRSTSQETVMSGVDDDVSIAFAVFDPEGRWLGTLEAPAGLAVTDVTDEVIVGVRKDDFDVAYVERWPILKP